MPKNSIERNTAPLWWEKTVEYAFVLRHLNDQIAFPLDGNQEVAGDVIIGTVNSWFLIEFKRDERLAGEEKKYSLEGNQKVKELCERYGYITEPHFYVYGIQRDGKFDIAAKSYWNKRNIKTDSISDSGTSFIAFQAYIQEVIEAKKGAEGSGGVHFETVVGVTADKKTICMSVAEFTKFCLKNAYVPEIPSPPKQHRPRC